MIDLIDGIFTSLVLLPGFLCVFLPHKIIDVKIRLSNFELTLISLIISAIIFILTLFTYLILQYTISSYIPIQLEISKITVSNLIDNFIFLFLFSLYTIGFFLIGLYSISHDILRPIRKKITGIDTISTPEKYVWDIALNKYRGYAIVETNTNDYFLGWIENWTVDGKGKEILLKYPEYIDFNKHDRNTLNDWIGIKEIDIHRILFLNSDIRRIYLVTNPMILNSKKLNE